MRGAGFLNGSLCIITTQCMRASEQGRASLAGVPRAACVLQQSGSRIEGYCLLQGAPLREARRGTGKFVPEAPVAAVHRDRLPEATTGINRQARGQLSPAE